MRKFTQYYSVAGIFYTIIIIKSLIMQFDCSRFCNWNRQMIINGIQNLWNIRGISKFTQCFAQVNTWFKYKTYHQSPHTLKLHVSSSLSVCISITTSKSPIYLTVDMNKSNAMHIKTYIKRMKICHNILFEIYFNLSVDYLNNILSLFMHIYINNNAVKVCEFFLSLISIFFK